MGLEIFGEYISLPIILFCLCVGLVLKYGLPGDKINKWIPLIVGLLGIAANTWYMGIFDFTTVTSGFFSGLASTGFYELFYQFIKNYGGDPNGCKRNDEEC